MIPVADLHTHTTVTDGRASPGQVITEAAARGLRELVITDHSVVTYAGLLEVAEHNGISLPFPGTEVSTFHEGARYHLLAYGPGLLTPDLQEFLLLPVRRKNAVAGRVIERLAEEGYPMPAPEEVRLYGDGPGAPATPEKRLVSRTAIARQLELAASFSPGEAYEKVCAVYRRVDEAGQPGDPGRLARRYLPATRVLDECAARGVTTSLAHPAWQCRTEADLLRVRRDLATFQAHGLAGMETRSYHHRPWDDHPVLLAARAALALLRTGGSDYHANGKTRLGDGGMGEAEFSEFADAVRERAATTARAAGRRG